MLNHSENEETFELVLKAFIEAAEQNYDYAFTTGYLGSLSRQMFSVLPKTKQRMFIASMVRAAAKQEAEVKEKRKETRTFERV